MGKINRDGGPGMSKVWRSGKHGDMFRETANHSAYWVKHSTGGKKIEHWGEILNFRVSLKVFKYTF